MTLRWVRVELRSNHDLFLSSVTPTNTPTTKYRHTEIHSVNWRDTFS